MQRGKPLAQWVCRGGVGEVTDGFGVTTGVEEGREPTLDRRKSEGLEPRVLGRHEREPAEVREHITSPERVAQRRTDPRR